MSKVNIYSTHGTTQRGPIFTICSADTTKSRDTSAVHPDLGRLTSRRPADAMSFSRIY